MSSDQEEASYMIVVRESILRVEENPFFEVEKSTMRSLQLRRRGECSADPAIRLIVEWAVRCCLEGQTAGLLESAEASPPRFLGPSQFLAQTAAGLTQRLGQELTSQ